MADPILDDPSVPTFQEDPAQWQAPVEAPSVQDLLDQGYVKGTITQAPNFSQQDFLDAGYQLGTITQPPIDFVQAHDHLWNEFTGDEFLSSHPGLPAIDGTSSRGFDGDKSIKDMTAQIGQSYEDLMKQAGAPQEDIDKGRKYIEAAVGRRAKQLALQTLANTQPRYNSEWEKDPFFGDIRKRVHDRQVANAVKNISTGNGEMNDYLQLASELKRQDEDAKRGTLGNVGMGFLGAGKVVSQIGMLSPAAQALGAGTGSTFIGRAAATGFGYTAAQFPLTGMQDLLDGKALSDVAKEEAGQFIDNSILMGLGGLGQYASMPQGAIRKGGALLFDALKLVGSADVSEDTKKMIGLSHEAGPITRMLGAAIEKDPKKLADAFADLWQNQGALVAINAAMHVIQQGHRGDPKALAEKLIAQEMLPKDATPTEPTPDQHVDRLMDEATKNAGLPAQPEIVHPVTEGAEGTPGTTTYGPPRVETPRETADRLDKLATSLRKQMTDAGLKPPEINGRLRALEQQLDRARGLAQDIEGRTAKVAEAQEAPKTAPAAPEAEKAPEAAPAPERRQDVERRRAVAEMSPEEMRKELLTNPVTGLPNRRAFDEAGPAKAVGMSDADGLKALNDKFGYEAGDTMLRAKAEALKEAGLDAYHEKGDEFLYRGDSKEELGQKLERARSILRDKIIHTEKEGDFKGADFSYGHGADRAEAETGLKAHKAQREAAGERARGELRGITPVGAGPGGENLGRAAPGDHGETPAPRSAIAPHPLEPHIRNALTRDEVGTSKEIWQDVNQQRQKKGLAKAPFAQVREALDRMKGRGDIIEHPGAEGDDPIHTLTGQEGEATPEAVEKAKRDLKESINADIANRQRNGGEPASVRRALNGDLQKATPLARSAIAREEAAAGQGAGAAGVPEVPHAAGASTERPESAPGGGSPASGDIVAKAKELRALDRDDVADHNAIMRDVWRRLKAEGVEPRDYKKKFEDASKVPGLDEAAGYWGKERPDKFVRPGEEPSDILHDMLGKGMRKPMTVQQSQAKAEEYLAGQMAPEEKNGVEQAFRRNGFPAETAAEHAARIEREVAAEAAAEEAREQAEESLRPDTGPGAKPEEVEPGVSFRREPGAGEPTGRGGLTRSLTDMAHDLVREEGGAVDLDEAIEKGKAAARYTKHAMQRFAGKLVPTITDMSREAGEAVANLIGARPFAKIASEHYGDKVLGRDSTPEFDRLVGATILETRARHARQQHVNAGDMDKATAVRTFIGAQNSPFQSEADYQAALKNPEVNAARQRYRDLYVPEKNQMFRDAQGLDPQDPIDSRTQLPDEPISALGVEEGNQGTPSTAWVGSRGSPKNLKLYRNPRAMEATLSGGGYEMDLRNIIENDFNRGYPLAAKAKAYRVSEAEGIGKWAPPVKEAGWTEMPFTNPPKGTQNAEPGDVFHVKDEAAGEWHQALNIDKTPAYAKVLSAMNWLPNQAALASSVEAASHSVNLATALFTKPSGAWHGGLGDVFYNAYQRVMNYPAFRERLMELARINAAKPRGMESGKILPESLKAFDPTYYAGRLLDGMSDIMRMTLSDGYDRMVQKGIISPEANTATNKRDFINQSTGQYMKEGQNGLVRWFRDTGLGPFATAGTTFNVQGAKALGLGTNVTAGNVQGALVMRGEVLAKMAVVLGGIAAYNYARWGNPLGDSKTPFMNLKLGDDEKGKNVSLDLSPLVLAKRGLRDFGALGYLEAQRQGKTEGVSEDKGVMQALRSLAHPFMGPAVSFGHTVVTGNNIFGMPIADRAGPNQSQMLRNAKAAMMNANPAVSALTGADEPPKQRGRTSTGERAMKLLGPLAPQFRSAPKNSGRR